MSVKWLTKKDKNGRIIRYSVPWYDYDYYGMFSGDSGTSAGGSSQTFGTWDELNQITFDQMNTNMWEQLGV